MPMIEDCVHQHDNQTTVVTLNGQGCKALKASKYDSASDYFSIALYMLQEGLKHASDDAEDRNQEGADYHNQDHAMDVQAMQESIMNVPLTLCPSSSCTYGQNSPSESASSCPCMNHEVAAAHFAAVGIYKVPRKVSTRSSNMSCISDYNMVASALIFNLALSHHLAAFETNGGQPDKARLIQALRAYELVYKLHMEEGQSSSLNPFYAMAALNNLARVHYGLLDEQRANQCAEALLSNIVWFGYHQEESSEVFFFFFGTVQHLILTDSHTAIAA